MSDKEAWERLLNQIHDLHIRPLAHVITQTLAFLIKNKGLTKDEARYSVANAVRIITPTEWSLEAKENAASVLRDMLSAIESTPDAIP